MSITDELRGYAQSWRETPNLMEDLDAGDIDGLLGDLEHIADRIDMEHERRMVERADRYSELRAKMNNCYIELPVDADNVPWNVGDRDEDGNVVIELRLTSDGWFVITDGEWPYRPESKRHHHAPTVEGVLREFANECLTYATCVDDHEVADAIELYAAKLRLAEGED